MSHERKVIGKATDEELASLKDITLSRRGLDQSLNAAMSLYANEAKKLEACEMEVFDRIRSRLELANLPAGTKMTVDWNSRDVLIWN